MPAQQSQSSKQTFLKTQTSKSSKLHMWSILTDVYIYPLQDLEQMIAAT